MRQISWSICSWTGCGRADRMVGAEQGAASAVVVDSHHAYDGGQPLAQGAGQPVLPQESEQCQCRQHPGRYDDEEDPAQVEETKVLEPLQDTLQ